MEAASRTVGKALGLASTALKATLGKAKAEVSLSWLKPLPSQDPVSVTEQGTAKSHRKQEREPNSRCLRIKFPAFN